MVNYNLKRGGGSFKGLIGECMFKLANKNVVITKFFNKNKYFVVFGKYFNNSQLTFLSNHWFSIDAIDIEFINGNAALVLYEIKTRNKYAVDLNYKPKMTLETHNMYNHAKQMGFIVKLATVWLHEDWEYTIEITEFEEQFYCIDKPKLYDLKRSD